MTPGHWQDLHALLRAALQRQPTDRAAFIEEVCAGNEALRERVFSLLCAHEAETALGDQPSPEIGEPAAEIPPSLSSGAVLLHRFQVLRFLGRGGMGEVYEANDSELGRIALKIIRPEIANDPRTLDRFRHEVRLARTATGSNVCRIHELFLAPQDSTGTSMLFLTMEFLEGKTLSDRIRESSPLPFDEVERIALQLCAGLGTIHAAGIVHRDFKSRNIMLAERNGATQAVVTDFGLARQAALSAAAAAGSSITVPGTVVGTPQYMAPEQLEGVATGPAADIYALGIVLYQMTTGALPFPSTTLGSAAVERTRRPPPTSAVRPGLPRHWDAVVDRCLAYDPADRFQSAAEVAQALARRHFDRQGLSTVVPAHSGRKLALAGGLLLVLAAAVFSFFRYRDTYHPPSPEAQHWYEEGVAALREGTYLKAINALERSTSLDRNFVLAHARLADAWNELDFTGNAQKEMLLASSPDLNRTLPALDKRYVDAIRATLTLDFTGALRDYQAILRALPKAEKAFGYVDLGRAYERAGHLPEAIEAYSQAAKLAPENPAPFVHLGILESRQKHMDAANAAFIHAETLYRAASNLEGLAEIDYQRGNVANTQGQLTEARAFLEKSLQAAQAIPSVQLEIRALTRLSTTEYLGGDTDKSIELAQRAIQLAQDNRIEYWATDGFIRLGTAYLMREEYPKAETYLQQGLRLARESERPRLEANAKVMLASLREREGRPQEVILLATPALDYYQHNGFVTEAGDALTIMARAQLAESDYIAALHSAVGLLALAKKTGSAPMILRAESTAGNVFLHLERYPEALQHLQAALDISRRLGQQVEYYAVDVSETLWRLGRYKDAQLTIKSLTNRQRSQAIISSQIDQILAEICLSQNRCAEALKLTRQAYGGNRSSTGPELDLDIMSGVAQCRLGLTRTAEATCNRAAAGAERQQSPEIIAKVKLAQAEIYLAENAPDKASSAATAAYNFFSRSGERESEWRSLFYLASSHQRLGNTELAKKFASEALDILSGFEHNWSTQVFRVYVSRPDVSVLQRKLLELSRR